MLPGLRYRPRLKSTVWAEVGALPLRYISTVVIFFHCISCSSTNFHLEILFLWHKLLLKTLMGSFQALQHFSGGGGQCQCPPNKYYTFFHRKPVQVGASTAARIRVTGVAPSLPWEGAPPPLMGDTPSPPPLWSFAPPFPQASPYSYIITLYHFFQKSITLQFYVTLSWNFAGCKKFSRGGWRGRKGGEQGASAPSPLFPHMNVHVMCSIGQVQNNKVGVGEENVTTKQGKGY